MAAQPMRKTQGIQIDLREGPQFAALCFWLIVTLDKKQVDESRGLW